MVRWLVMWGLAMGAYARAQVPRESLELMGVREFTAAYAAWDGARFATSANLLSDAATNRPPSSTNLYWQGVAHFHRLLQLQTLPASPTNQAAAEAAIESALAALGQAVGLNDRDAECHALLGTLYGMKIRDSTFRALRFGPRVAKHQKKALECGSDNPRVRYLLGTCQFHTAKSAAAKREALATFLQAEKLFAEEAKRDPGPLEPRWGWSSCLTFAGRTCESLGQLKEAADYFRKALAMHAADHLAREGLARLTPAK